MEEIEKLHEVVVKQGLYTKSLDEFKQKYSDKESIDKLYSVVSEKGLYTKEKDNFYDKYFPSQKKNQVGNGDSTTKETPSVSYSKIQPVTSLGGEKIPTVKASDTSTGVKKFRLPQESELGDMQQLGVSPKTSDVNKRKSVIPKGGLYDLAPNMKEQKPKVEVKKYKSKFELPGEKTKISPEKIAKAESLYNYVEGKKVVPEDIKNKKIAEIESTIENEDLNIEYPYLGNSTLNPNVTEDWNPETGTMTPVQKDNFVNDLFKEEKLKELDINPADFDGFLNAKGYKEEFLKKERAGLFEGEGSDISGGYDIQLAKEAQKLRLLNLYMADRDSRVNKMMKSSLNLDNLKTNQNNKYNPITVFDSKKIENYIETETPTYYKKAMEQKALDAKVYEESSKDNSWYYDTGIALKRGAVGAAEGFIDRINQVTTTTLNSVGLDSAADEMRLLNEERILSRPTMKNVSYVSGKSISKNGVNYIVDSEGNIYDADRKLNVNSVVNPFLAKEILNDSKKGEDSFIFSPMGASEQLSTVMGDMIVQFAMQRLVGFTGNIAKVPLITKGTASAIIAQSALGYSSGYENTYKAAIDAGISEKEARMLSTDGAQRMAILYGVTAPISTQEKAVSAIFGADKKALIDKAIKEYVKSGTKGFVSTMKTGLSTMTKEGVKETFQEEIQQSGEMLVNSKINKQAKQKLLKDYMTVDDFINTGILSFGAGNLMASVHSFSKADKLSLLKQMTNNEDLFVSQVPDLVSNNVMTQSQADELKNDLHVYKNQSRKIPSDLSTEVAMDVMRDLQDVQDLEGKKKTLDPSFHEDIDAKIEEKRAKIKENLSKSKLYEEARRKERSDREAANKEKPTGDQAVSEYTQPTGEGEKGVRGVQEKVDRIYYYNTDPERGAVEAKPKVLPEGYSTATPISNGFELDAWKKQKAYDVIETKVKTGLGVSESYSDIESVPEFMKPLAKPGAKGETTVNGKTKQTQRYSVIATAEELQDAYDNFYGKEEQVTPTEADSAKKIESLRQDEQQELLDAIPNASNALTDGKVDKDKLTTPEDKAKFDEIYDKYDKLITPLLEVTKPTEAKGTPDVVSEPISLTPAKEDVVSEPIDLNVERRVGTDEEGNFTIAGVKYKYVKSLKDSKGNKVIHLKDSNGKIKKVTGQDADEITRIQAEKRAKAEAKVTEESDLSEEEFDAILKDIEFNEREYGLKSNVNKKMFYGDQPGILKIENGVKYVFEADNGVTHELGSVEDNEGKSIQDYGIFKDYDSANKAEPSIAEKRRAEKEAKRKEQEDAFQAEKEKIEAEAEKEAEKKRKAVEKLSETDLRKLKKGTVTLSSGEKVSVSETTLKDGSKSYKATTTTSDGKSISVIDSKKIKEAVGRFEANRNKLVEKTNKAKVELDKSIETEKEDRIYKALTKLINATDTRGKMYSGALPLIIINNATKIVRASYVASKNMAAALKQGYDYVVGQGYNITEAEFKKQLLTAKQTQKEPTAKEPTTKEPTTTKKTTPSERAKTKVKEVKAKLAESETEVKDLKGQVRDVFKAAVEAVRQAKANARTDAKAYSDFVAMKQAALADYLAKNLSGKITAKEAASIIKSVSKASDEAIEKVNKLIDKVAKRTEREAKNELKKSIKENLKEGKITSGEGVKNIKVTLSAKRYLLDARKIDLESMDLDQLAQLDRDIADVLATGVATRKAMNEVIKRRRRDIEAEAIVRYERKFKQGVESDNIDMYETLKAKNIVILEDGTVFFPEDYKQTEFMPPQKGTVISENATKQQANKSFLDKSGFPAVAKYVYSKLGEIPKYHFSLTYRFYDLLSDTESQDFFNKNVFDKLEKFRNRVDNRATNYSKSLNDKIYGTQPVNKKLSTLFKSNLFKTARVFAKKEGLSIGGVTLVKKGVTENIEFGQTDLVLEERTGKKENILKGATNSEVINLYNSLRDYKFLTKTFMKGGRFDLNDALKVINYVNQNPELRRRAEALVDTYAEIAVDLSAKMDEIGKNLNVGEYLTEDEYRASSLAKNNGDQAIANAQTAQYMSILRAFYGNNIPKIIPYVPISAEKVSSESSTGSEILDGNGFYNPSLAFPNLLERKGGGNLVLKSYQESFDEYTKNVSRFIEGNDLLSDFTAMFNGDHSKKILTQQFGEQWVKKANDGLVETILENDRSLNSPMSKFISLGAVNVLLFNPTSATSQLSSAPGFLASLNEAERKEYFKIMKDSNKRKEYQSKILNSNYIANRANMSNHEYDAAMLKRLSTEGGMFSFGGLVGDFISDAMILTSLSDAASIVYGGSGLFGVKYEAKLKEYLKTMNRADASKKAEEEAMLDLASASEKTQQSSQVAFVSEFRRNPVLRALGATAFASSSLQAGEMAIKSFRDLKNGRGDKKENIKKVLYFGTLAPTIFTLTAALIRGAFDDDDDPLVKIANDALNTSLEQLTTVGKVVAMVKDYYLEQYAPEAVGLRMKYNTDDNDLIVKYGSDFSPGLGVKVRDIKAAIDSKGKRTIVERGAAGVQAATNIPLKRMVDIGTNWTIAFNSEYANMVRLKGLFLQIPESERFKHREHIESIKKQADDLVRLSPEQSIVASKIKDPIEKKRFVDDALLERKFKFINYRLNEWFKDGYSDSKNAERMQQQDNNAIEDITENYLRDYVDATLSKDKKAVIESLDKLLGRIDYYEKNNSSAHAAIVNKLDSKITEILKEDIEYFASVKKFSSGKPRAVAIYSKIGAMLTEDFESPGTLGMIRVLDSEGLLDDSTVKEYYKYVQEKKREAK